MFQYYWLVVAGNRNTDNGFVSVRSLTADPCKQFPLHDSPAGRFSVCYGCLDMCSVFIFSAVQSFFSFSHLNFKCVWHGVAERIGSDSRRNGHLRKPIMFQISYLNTLRNIDRVAAIGRDSRNPATFNRIYAQIAIKCRYLSFVQQLSDNILSDAAPSAPNVFLDSQKWPKQRQHPRVSMPM